MARFQSRFVAAGVGAALLLLPFGGARAEEGTFAAGVTIQKVDAFVQAQMRRQHLPGLALAVVRDGKLVVVLAWGARRDSLFPSCPCGGVEE